MHFNLPSVLSTTVLCIKDIFTFKFVTKQHFTSIIFNFSQVGNPPDLSFLPSNFFANNLLASLALTSEADDVKRVLCDNCDAGDPAETRCQQCGVFLCHFCTESHQRSRATKSHAVVSIKELKCGEPSRVAETIKCTKHKEEVIKLYCKTCEKTICRDCAIVDHRNHEYSFVEDVASEEKLNLKEILGEVKERKARVQEGITNLKEFKENLTKKEESVTSEINQHFDYLVEAVQCQRKKLLENAASMMNSKQKQIHAQLEELEMALANCESSIEFTDQAFINGNDVQILSMRKYILHSLEDLKKAKDQLKPCVHVNMKFTIPSSVQKIEVVLQSHSLDDTIFRDKFDEGSVNLEEEVNGTGIAVPRRTLRAPSSSFEAEGEFVERTKFREKRRERRTRAKQCYMT